MRVEGLCRVAVDGEGAARLGGVHGDQRGGAAANDGEGCREGEGGKGRAGED